jgi:Tol biopolymer transport system component
VLAPDGRQLVADGNGMIWVVDLERGVPTRIGTGTLPAWGPKGEAVVFTRRAATTADVVMKALAGEDSDRVLVRSREMKLSGDWSRDGRHFVYVASSPETKLDVWVLDAGANADTADAARPFLQTPFNEMQPRLSPDGRWIAYTSDETGSWEVYVQSFPMPGAKRAVSLNGGTEPQWTKGGGELVYLRSDATLVAVRMSADGPALQPSMAQPLFRVPLAGDITAYRNNYAVTADGSRFLVDTADESTREPISVVVHWPSLLGD